MSMVIFSAVISSAISSYRATLEEKREFEAFEAFIKDLPYELQVSMRRDREERRSKAVELSLRRREVSALETIAAAARAAPRRGLW